MSTSVNRCSRAPFRSRPQVIELDCKPTDGVQPHPAAVRSRGEHLGQLIHQRRQAVAEDLGRLADAAVLHERGVLERLGRYPEFAGDVLLHPGQPLQLLHRERDPLLLLCTQPRREPLLNLVAERDKFVVLVQRVPHQRHDVGEHPAA